LNNPSLNGYRYQFLNNSIHNYTWLGDNLLAVWTSDSWQVNSTDLARGTTTVAETLVDVLDYQEITYLDCYTNITELYSVVNDTVNEAINKYVLSTLDVSDICISAQASCVGTLYPFDTVAECIAFMHKIPTSCNDGVNSLLGNTSNCRFLHATAAAVNPVVHCQHVSRDSTFCVQADCENEQYGPLPPARFGTVVSNQFQIVVVSVLVCIVAFLPAALYIVYLLRGMFEMGHMKGLLLGVDGYTAVSEKDLQQRRQGSFFSSKTTAPTKLEVSHFGYTTDKNKRLLCDVHFKAAGGDLVAVMGPSGAGKTTLLKALAGVHLAGSHQGALTYDGESVAQSESHLAFCDQYPERINLCQPRLTVREALIVQAIFVYMQKVNETGGLDISRDEFVSQGVCSVVDSMSLAAFLDTEISRLSGGQHKRLSVAHHLMYNPNVLIIDEPTSGLDSFAASSMMVSLRQLAMKRSMLIIASIHQPPNSILAEFDHVLVMKKGGHGIIYDNARRLLEGQEELHHRIMEFAHSHKDMSSAALSTIVAAIFLADLRITGGIGTDNNNNGLGATLPVSDIFAILQETKCVEAADAAKALRLQAEKQKSKVDRMALDGLAVIIEELSWQDNVSLTSAVDTSSLGAVLLCKAELSDIVQQYPENFKRSISKRVSSRWLEHVMEKSEENDRDWTTGVLHIAGRQLSALQMLQLRPILAWSHWKATPIVDQLVYPIGSFVAAGFLALMYPQLSVTYSRQLYGFASSLLVLMAILANLVFLNQVLQRIGRERNMLVQAFAARGDSLALRVVGMLLCNSASTVISLMLVFWLYYFVVGWDTLGASFGSVVNSMLSMKILMDIMAVYGTMTALYLPQAASVGLTGFWLGWNTVFAGVLIRVQDLWVIWRYWSAYVTPFYHIINVWMWEAFYEKSITCFPRVSQFVSACPPDGNQVLIDQGYSYLYAGYSMAILLCTWVAYVLCLGILLYAGRRPHTEGS
jgi:ABC-type multidrug transport system ATPase subunit